MPSVFQYRVCGKPAGDRSRFGTANGRAVARHIDVAAAAAVGVGARQPLAERAVIGERGAGKLGELGFGLQSEPDRNRVAFDRMRAAIPVAKAHAIDTIRALEGGERNAMMDRDARSAQ